MYPKEIDFNKFQLSQQISRGNYQWSVKILYDNEILNVQTPTVVSTFNLQGYQYNESSPKKYSLNITLDDKVEGMEDFIKLVETIDECARQSAVEDYNVKDCLYVSPIKTPNNPKYQRHLRCKMVSNSTKFKFEASLNGKPFIPTIKAMEEHIKRGTKMELILQLNPIWKVQGKYGVSYQIVAMNILKKDYTFRKPNQKKMVVEEEDV